MIVPIEIRRAIAAQALREYADEWSEVPTPAWRAFDVLWAMRARADELEHQPPPDVDGARNFTTADAWEDGYTTGHDDCATGQTSPTRNPYRNGAA